MPAAERLLRRALGSVVITLCMGGSALAEEDRSSKIIAEQLFEEARTMFDRGQIAPACEKLRESERLDPAGGTALLLGICYENEGKLASAWSALRSARAMAIRDGRDDRRQTADAHLGSVEPKLAHLTVNVPPAARLPGLVVRLDGVELADAALDLPLPVDPGSHELRVFAPGHTESRSTLIVPEVSHVEIAPLPSDHPASAPETSPLRPVLLATTGAAALIAGGITFYFGIGAIVAEEKKPLSCQANDSSCISSSRSFETQRTNDATAATVGGAFALASAAAFVTMLVLPPRAKKAGGRWTVSPFGTAGAVIGGAF